MAGEIGVSPAVPPGSTRAREGTQGTPNDDSETIMTKRVREQRREQFLTMITAAGRTRVEGIRLAAELLHVSEHTVVSWLKPQTSKSSNEIPLMAIELLEYKLANKPLRK